MHRLRSITCTDPQQGSFAGASPTNFIGAWIPVRSAVPKSARPADFVNKSLGTGDVLDIDILPTNADPHAICLLAQLFTHQGVQFTYRAEAREDAVRRFLCHLAIDKLPGEALPDVCSAIQNAWEFHQPPPPPALPFLRQDAGTFEIAAVPRIVDVQPFSVTED